MRGPSARVDNNDNNACADLHARARQNNRVLTRRIRDFVPRDNARARSKPKARKKEYRVRENMKARVRVIPIERYEPVARLRRRRR